jgi:hypothetical protein
VFQKMLANACRVCEANFGFLQLWDGECFTSPASYSVPPELAATRRERPVTSATAGISGESDREPRSRARTLSRMKRWQSSD